MRYWRVAWLPLVLLSSFSAVSGSLPFSRCFSGFSGSPARSSTYRAAYALKLGAPSLTCLSETSLSIHHLLSLDWLADLIACASFSRLALPHDL